jgi:hypothetical protein
VETEGPQSNERNGQPPGEPNVVQLGDWIGPRDELVPFGRRSRPRRGERPLPPTIPADSEPKAAPATGQGVFQADAMPDPPPSAEDFWGERAAAIHDALEAPVDHRPSYGGGADAGGVADNGSGSSAPSIGRGPVSAHRARVRYRGLRSKSLAAAACLAILALAGFALALHPFGARTPRHALGGVSKLPLASVLSNALSRALTRDLPRIGSAAPHHHAAFAGRNRIRRHPVHLRSIAQPVHASTPVLTSGSVGAHPTAAYASHETSTTPTSTYTPSPPPANASSSTARAPSSNASVSATGASGALGPIQSPNG